MYICSVCSFATTVKREWDRHFIRHGHVLRRDEDIEISEVLEDSFETVEVMHEEAAIEPGGAPPAPFLDSLPTTPEHDNESVLSYHSSGGDSWFPWKSRAHFYLCVLYHGSHRRYFMSTFEITLFKPKISGILIKPP